jgi:hypothetical protein
LSRLQNTQSLNRSVGHTISLKLGDFAMALWIIAAAFSAVGVPVVWIGLHFLGRDRAIARWPRAPGVIISSSIETSRGQGRDNDGFSYAYQSYTPVVRYTYSVNGQVLKGNQIARAVVSNTSLSPIQACINKYPTGKDVMVRYDPSDAKTAYLEVRRSVGAVIILAFGGFWIALGTLLFALALRA